MYKREDLVGKNIIAVVNFRPKQIADFISEDLVNLLKGKKWDSINLDKAYNDTRKCEPQYVAKQITELYKEVKKHKFALFVD